MQIQDVCKDGGASRVCDPRAIASSSPVLVGEVNRAAQ
jgi:hypothetical protein